MLLNSSILKFFILVLLFFNFQTLLSQNIKPSSRSYSIYNRVIPEEGILEDGKYTYKFRNKTVTIEIKEGYYYEYYPKKEYIKAEIYWLTKSKFILTIVDFQKKGFPLKVGSKLTTQIINKKGNEYFYTSTLNRKTRKGSFKKVN